MIQTSADRQFQDAGDSIDRCHALLRPHSIAVVGASDRPGPGQRVIANLRAAGFDGRLYPVNPKRDQIAGIPAFPGLQSLPEVPDLVVAAVNRDTAVTAVTEAAALGSPAAILLGAGFGEVDERGRELDSQLRALAPTIAMMGPNCLGYVNLEDGVAPYSGPLMEPPICGNVALVSNSGALACTFTGAAAERGIHFSHVITTGNQIDLTVADYVRHLARRPATRTIACYLEGFRDGRSLLAAFREARQQGKEIILLKGGRSRLGAAAAQTHTGALAGSSDIQDSLWRECRVLVADEPEEFLALIELSSRASIPSGPNIGMITISGGERLLLADRAEAVGLQLAPLSDATRAALSEILPPYATPSNPLDSTGAGLVERNGEVHAAAAELLARDPSVDLLLVCQDIKNGWVQSDQSGTLFWDAIRSTWEAVAPAGKPVIVISPTTGQIDERACAYLHDHRIPMLLGLTSGMDALAKYLASHVGGPPAQPVVRREVAMGAGAMTGYHALSYLAARGIPVSPTEMARSEDEAVAVAVRLGYPVALKIDSPGLLHRTEVGGVRVDLRTESDVRRAWRELAVSDIWGESLPTILVQPMVRGGVELFIGGVQDEQFGPVVLAGAGGTLAEFIRDVGAGLAPLDPAGAERLIDSVRVRRLLAGWRGVPPADRAAIARALVAISELIARPEVEALDVNPLIALPTAVTVVDAKLVLRDADGRDEGNVETSIAVGTADASQM